MFKKFVSLSIFIWVAPDAVMLSVTVALLVTDAPLFMVRDGVGRVCQVLWNRRWSCSLQFHP